MAEKKKKAAVQLVTPVGILLFPRLDVPDPGKEGKFAYKVPVYKTGLRLKRTDPGVQAFLDKLDEMADAAYAAALADESNAKGIADAIREAQMAAKKKNPTAPIPDLGPTDVVERAAPYRVDMNEKFEELGTVTLSFKMNSTYTHPTTKVVTQMRPEVVDSKKNKIDPVKTKIYGGTRARLVVEFKDYGILQGSAGLAKYLKVVQVIELVNGTSSVDALDDIEGYEVDDFDSAPTHSAGGGEGDDQF